MTPDMHGESAKKFGQDNTLTADCLRDLLQVAENFGIQYHGDADWAHSYGEEILSYETGETIEYGLHVDNDRQWHHVMKALDARKIEQRSRERYERYRSGQATL